ncbi:MAG: hypothetical protein PVG39_00885 [Desulfobacteraceae bacterium]|jgi:hypothetical protein
MKPSKELERVRDLQMHETLIFDIDEFTEYEVLRVDTGYIYTRKIKHSYHDTTSVFVPIT